MTCDDPAPKPGYDLEFSDDFDAPELDLAKWLPTYLPQWSSRERGAARYRLSGRQLHLQIAEDQPPWCPAYDGATRVSSLQTGVFAGPPGSRVGQHRFHPELSVAEAQTNARLYTPQYGYFELRAKAIAARDCMVALWMIGYEDLPERSGEICICEIFGKDVQPGSARVGMGVRAFSDPNLVGDFSQESVEMDATDFHVYAAEWTPAGIDFFIDGRRAKTVHQSPGYPMQLMLGIYEFERRGDYPKEFVVDYVRGYRAKRDATP